MGKRAHGESRLVGTLKRITLTDRWWEDPVTGIKYLEVYVKNVRRRISSGEVSLEKAEKKRRELERTAAERHRKQKGLSSNAFEVRWDAWVELNKTIWRQGTLADIKSVGKCHMKPFFEKYLITEVDAELWKKYVALKLSNRPDMRLARHQAYLTMFLNSEAEAGRLTKAPGLFDPDPEVDAAVVISYKEEAEILEACQDEDLRLGFTMGIRLGMREYEIFGLAKDRVDASTWFINLRAEDTKTGKGRSVPVVDKEIIKDLKKRLEAEDTDWIFPSPRNKTKSRWFPRDAWDEVREKTGIDVTFHNTRHTAATRFAEVMQPTHAARILGMSIEIFDKRYCRVKDKELKSAMERMNAR